MLVAIGIVYAICMSSGLTYGFYEVRRDRSFQSFSFYYSTIPLSSVCQVGMTLFQGKRLYLSSVQNLLRILRKMSLHETNPGDPCKHLITNKFILHIYRVMMFLGFIT
jgi:hypothetical protein